MTVLRVREFRLAWTSYALSDAATSITPVALTLYLLDTAGGLDALGLVLGSRMAGFVTGAVVGGAIADGFARRTILTLASALRGVAIIAATGAFSVSVGAICVCVALAGAGESVFRGAYQAFVAEVVADADLERANAATSVSNRLLLVIGPTLAALAYVAVGGALTLLWAGLLWLASSFVATALPRGSTRPCDAPAPWRLADVRDVLREAGRHRWFVAGLAALVLWLGIGFAAQQLTLPLISRETLGGDAFLGVALGAYAAGALATALTLSRWAPRRPGVLAFGGLGAFCLVPLSLAVVSAVPSLPIELASAAVLFAHVVSGAGIEAFNIPWFSAIQREIPKDKLGRIFSLDFTISYSAAPVGLVLLPVALTSLGRVPVLLICAGLTLAVALAALAVPGARDLAEPR